MKIITKENERQAAILKNLQQKAISRELSQKKTKDKQPFLTLFEASEGVKANFDRWPSCEKQEALRKAATCLSPGVG